MNYLIILLFLLGIIITAVLVFFGYLLYTNGKNSEKTSTELAEKESELLELYTSLEQMMKEIEVYTQKAKSEIKTDIERIKMLNVENSRQIQDECENKQIFKKVYNRNEDMDYAEKCRLVRMYHVKNHTISEIAKIMGLGQGEVKLILDLKKII